MFPVDADGSTENEPNRFVRPEIVGVGADGTDNPRLIRKNICF
jgi:hypothetical protein